MLHRRGYIGERKRILFPHSNIEYELLTPDLRRLSAEKHSIFKQIVYDGIIHGAGMPRMGDLVSEQDVHDIHGYIIERTKQDRAAAARP